MIMASVLPGDFMLAGLSVSLGLEIQGLWRMARCAVHGWPDDNWRWWTSCCRISRARSSPVTAASAVGSAAPFGHDDGNAPPPTVVASTMVTIVNLIGLVVGASILVMMLVNLYVPSFEIDPLLAKGMIYFFGHVFINAVIYMAVIAVYEILPRYTQRPWKSNKVFLASWTASTIMVMFIFPHHLLMDYAYPKWFLIVGHIIGYLNTFPILIVTGYGALMIVYRSGIRWDMCSRLLFVSVRLGRGRHAGIYRWHNYS